MTLEQSGRLRPLRPFKFENGTETEQENVAGKKDLSVLKELGEMELPEDGSNIHCLTVVGQIEGHRVLPPKNKATKYEHILPQLVAIEQSEKIEGLLIILNTIGGDIEAGLAIAEMVSSMDKPSVSLVLGGGHSIGVPVAVAADHSFIAESASMTIHPIRLTGLVVGIPQTYEYLDRMQERVTSFITEHARIDSGRYKNLMFRSGELVRDIGTVLIGEDAVEEGIIEEIGGLGPALDRLKLLIGRNR